jgi:Uma2 family endonuclease
MNLQSSAVKLSASYRYVLDAPSDMVAEIIRTALHLQSRPAMPHAQAGFMLGVEIGGLLDRGRGGPDGWWIVDDPELHLGEDIVVPDLAGWRRDRIPRCPRDAYVTLAPDWVCEILSPSTRGMNVGPKHAIYRERGVGWLWLVDPDALSLEVFALRDGAWAEIGTLTGSDEVSMPPFDAISFPLSALWTDEEQERGDKPECD